MLRYGYKVGLVLRMINRESLKHIQNQFKGGSSSKYEYQTFRLFAILGALTLLFVLMVRIVQYGPNPASQNPAANAQQIESKSHEGRLPSNDPVNK